MLLTLRERILHDTSMARRRQLHCNTIVQPRLEVSHTSSIIPNLLSLTPAHYDRKDTHPRLAIGLIIKHIDRRRNGGKRHLWNDTILRLATSATLMHHADCRDITFRRPPAVQHSGVPVHGRRVNSHLDYPKWPRSANKYIASAVPGARCGTLGAD